MASDDKELPIVFAKDVRTGELRHVDEVANGLACNCVCPACGQPMIARQGEHNAHSFAHKSGECKWATECVITTLAEQAVREGGLVALPRLDYKDSCEGREVRLSPARTMRAISVEPTKASGRGAPDLLVTIEGGGRHATYSFVFCLVHSLRGAQADALMGESDGVVLVDLRLDLREKRKGLDRHHDRKKLAEMYQDPDLISEVLLDESSELKSWCRNRRAEKAEAESVAKHDAELAEARARDEERRRQEAEAAKRRAEEERKHNNALPKAEFEEIRHPDEAATSMPESPKPQDPFPSTEDPGEREPPSTTSLTHYRDLNELIRCGAAAPYLIPGNRPFASHALQAFVRTDAKGECVELRVLVNGMNQSAITEIVEHVGHVPNARQMLAVTIASRSESRTSMPSVVQNNDGSLELSASNNVTQSCVGPIGRLLDCGARVSINHPQVAGILDVIGIDHGSPARLLLHAHSKMASMVSPQ